MVLLASDHPRDYLAVPQCELRRLQRVDSASSGILEADIPTRCFDCLSNRSLASASADYVDASIMCSHGRFHAPTVRLERQAPISSST